jgi:membrane-bound lytic murein transglycosylase MltF
MGQPFTGDFDQLIERRAIRVGVTFNRTHYFIDQGQERGITYESLKLFENDLNADLKTGNVKVHVVIVPMSRDQLYPALASGKVDMVAAMVTVTPEREKLVAYSHEREPGRGHRARSAADRHAGRSGRPRSVRPQFMTRVSSD